MSDSIPLRNSYTLPNSPVPQAEGFNFSIPSPAAQKPFSGLSLESLSAESLMAESGSEQAPITPTQPLGQETAAAAAIPAQSGLSQNTPQEEEMKIKVLESDPRMTGNPIQDIGTIEMDLSTPKSALPDVVKQSISSVSDPYMLQPPQVDNSNLSCMDDDGSVYQCPFTDAPCSKPSFFRRIGNFFRKIFGISTEEQFQSACQKENLSDPIAFESINSEIQQSAAQPAGGIPALTDPSQSYQVPQSQSPLFSNIESVRPMLKGPEMNDLNFLPPVQR